MTKLHQMPKNNHESFTPNRSTSNVAVDFGFFMRLRDHSSQHPVLLSAPAKVSLSM